MIEQLNFLMGIWKGEGHAAFPTITSQDYIEELSFESSGNEIFFVQKTWFKSDNKPLHWESGFFIAEENGTFTFLNAQNSNRTEVMTCILETPTKLICDLKVISNDDRPVKTKREFSVEGNTLHYKVFMQTQNQPFQLHLEAKLNK